MHGLQYTKAEEFRMRLALHSASVDPA